MKKRFAIPLSIFIIMATVLWMQFNMSRWKKQNIIIWDVIEYYSYLPALVHGDFTLRDSLLNKDFNYHAWALDGPRGEKVIKMSSGTAFFFAPFFAVAYMSDLISGQDINTFAPKYHMAVSLSAALFLFLGLLVLSRVLKRYFSPWATALSLMLIVLGTNLLHYSTAEPGMSHVYSFFLFSLFLLISLRWYEKPSYANSILLGLILGWIVLVRPTNGLILVVFLLYRFPGNLKLFVTHWRKLSLAALLSIAIFSLQMLYWKSVTGSWLYFSYADEGFFFAQPHIIDGLFSFRKGWFIYTPLALVSIGGFLLKSFPREWRWGMIAFLVLNIYLILSWWCWWYGGSFGLRAFIESYALLAIGLGAVLDWALHAGMRVKWSVISVVFLLMALNLFQSYQYKRTLIHWDSMSWKAYKGVFLKTKFPEAYATWLEAPDYESAKQGKE